MKYFYFEPHTINEHLELLVNSLIAIYLVRGEKTALIDAGIGVYGNLIDDELKRLGVRPDYLLITHSHFDHVGGAFALKQKYPHIKVFAHPRVKDILSRPSAVDRIIDLSKTDAAQLGLSDIDYDGFHTMTLIDEGVSDGRIIDLGRKVTLEAIYSPGHTKDCVSYFAPTDKTLFPGESAGAPSPRGNVMPEGSSSYRDYLSTIKRLDAVGAKRICFPHSGIFDGSDAKHFFAHSYGTAISYRDRIKAWQGEGKSLEDIIRLIEDDFYVKDEYLQPKNTFRINITATITSIELNK